MGAIPLVSESMGVFRNSAFVDASTACCFSLKPAVVTLEDRLLTDPSKVGRPNSSSKPIVTKIPVKAMELVADSKVPRLSTGLLNCK